MAGMPPGWADCGESAGSGPALLTGSLTLPALPETSRFQRHLQEAPLASRPTSTNTAMVPISCSCLTMRATTVSSNTAAQQSGPVFRSALAGGRTQRCAQSAERSLAYAQVVAFPQAPIADHLSFPGPWALPMLVDHPVPGRRGQLGWLSPGQHSHACVVGLKAHKHVPATLPLDVLHQTVTHPVSENCSHALHRIPVGTAKRASHGEPWPWLWAWARDLAAGMQHLISFTGNMFSSVSLSLKLKQPRCEHCRMKKILRSTVLYSLRINNRTHSSLDGRCRIVCMAWLICRKHPGMALSIQLPLQRCPSPRAGRLGFKGRA